MLKTLGVHFIRHPCLTRKLQVRPPAPKKAGLCLFVVAEVWRGLSKCGRWGRRVLAPTLCDRYHASLRLRSLGSAHPCTTRTVRVLPPAPKKAGLCLFRHSPAFLVPMAGVEPARYCYQRILSPSRLPIPSHRLIKMCCKTALHNGNNDFTV